MLDDEDFLIEDEEDIDYNILCNDTLENFPFIEDDVDALTDYELFSRGFGYLDEKKADKSEIPSLDNYYNKDEVDDLLDEKADKSEIPSLDNYYNKDEVDDLLDEKADVSDIPDVSNFITKDVNDLTYYTKSSDLSTVATTGDYDDLLDKPTIPDVSNFITKDVNDLTYYTKSSDLSTVATTGDYDDLLDKPTIPDVSNFITKDVNDLTYYTKTTDMNTALSNKANTTDLNVLKNYSTSETVVGTWVDNKPIYRQVFIKTSANTFSGVAPNNNEIIKMQCLIKRSGGNQWRNLPWLYASDSAYGASAWAGGFYFKDNEIIFQGGSNLLGVDKIIIIIEYTKTTD